MEKSTKHATIHNNAAAGTIYSKMFEHGISPLVSSLVPLYFQRHVIVDCARAINDLRVLLY